MGTRGDDDDGEGRSRAAWEPGRFVACGRSRGPSCRLGGLQTPNIQLFVVLKSL